MVNDNTLRILSRFREALERRGTNVERLVLFGSQVTGKAHEASDIDVVVVSSDFETKSFWDRIDILTQGIVEVWEPIEAIAKTPAEWDDGDSLFLDHVRDACVVVYDSRALAAPTPR